MKNAVNHRPVARLLTLLAYPLAVGGACVLAWWMLYVQALPLWSIGLPVAAGLLSCFLLERIIPYRKNWRPQRRDLLTDISYNSVNYGIREAATLLFGATILTLFASQPAASPTGSSIHVMASLWPANIHPLLQMVLALLILDFFEYWFHRASHRVGFLWRFHAVHHSPNHLYFFNAGRFHLIDWLVLITIEILVLMAIGADAKVVALALVYVQMNGSFQHSNIDVKLGWLNYLVSGPELHRWHHSKIVEESDSNFGNNVIVWDLLFGTYYLPKGRHVGMLGLLNPAYPAGFLRQLLSPFGKKIDKPTDYYSRQDFYHSQLNLANEQELASLHPEATQAAQAAQARELTQ